MKEDKCVSCGEIADDGLAMGRLCYFCIEKAVVYINSQQIEQERLEIEAEQEIIAKAEEENWREANNMY